MQSPRSDCRRGYQTRLVRPVAQIGPDRRVKPLHGGQIAGFGLEIPSSTSCTARMAISREPAAIAMRICQKRVSSGSVSRKPDAAYRRCRRRHRLGEPWCRNFRDRGLRAPTSRRPAAILRVDAGMVIDHRAGDRRRVAAESMRQPARNTTSGAFAAIRSRQSSPLAEETGVTGTSGDGSVSSS
jgi:hypothetical protein